MVDADDRSARQATTPRMKMLRRMGANPWLLWRVGRGLRASVLEVAERPQSDDRAHHPALLEAIHETFDGPYGTHRRLIVPADPGVAAPGHPEALDHARGHGQPAVLAVAIDQVSGAVVVGIQPRLDPLVADAEVRWDIVRAGDDRGSAAFEAAGVV